MENGTPSKRSQGSEARSPLTDEGFNTPVKPRRRSRTDSAQKTPQLTRSRRKSGSGRKLKRASGSSSRVEIREVNEKTYEGIWEGDLIVGVGTVRDRFGEYEGTFNEDLLGEGKGTKTFFNGDWHSGMYKQGAFHGNGTYVYQNGDRFDGLFVNNQLAKGIFRWTQGHVYAGTFVNGLPEGEGSKRCSDGRQYDGSWKEGKAHGWGIRTYPNGDRHEGMYQDDERHGFGRYKWQDGEQLDGFWIDGVLQGRARRTFANKDVVMCKAQDNRFSGLGVRRSAEYPSGCYVGFLNEEGQPQGLGCVNEIFQSSQRLLGPFDSDSMVVGFGIKVYAQGAFYAGLLKNSFPHGFGVFHWPNGCTHRGHWRYGKQHGKGEISYPDGCKMQSAWRNGIIHGQCKAQFPAQEIEGEGATIMHVTSEWADGHRTTEFIADEADGDLPFAFADCNTYDDLIAKEEVPVLPRVADDTLASMMLPDLDPFGIMPILNPDPALLVLQREDN